MKPKPHATPDDVAFGINACAMALQHGFARSVFYWKEAKNERVTEVLERARRIGLEVHPVDLQKLDDWAGGGVHQGILMRLKDIPEVGLEEIIEAKHERSLILILDRVTDPQNLGAVLRTAVAVGAHGIVLPRRRGAQLTPGVHRASAGLSFIAPVVSPQNLSQAARELQEAGYWIIAADSGKDSVDATSFDWPPRTAVILGNEGEGIAHMLLEHSDFAVSLPMDPRVESLNIGVACGALSYLWRRQWPKVAVAAAE